MINNLVLKNPKLEKHFLLLRAVRFLEISSQMDKVYFLFLLHYFSRAYEKSKNIYQKQLICSFSNFWKYQKFLENASCMLWNKFCT